MDNLEHESLEEEKNSSFGPGGSNADSSNPANTWQKIFKRPENPNYRYVDSLEEALLLLKKYEQETTTKFSCYKSDKMFGSGGKTFSSQKRVGGCTPLNLLRGCAICTRTFLQTKRDELMTLFQTMGTLFQIIGTKEKKITTTTTITIMIIIIIMIMIITI